MTPISRTGSNKIAEASVAIYGPDDFLPISLALVLGFQHVLSMFMGVITPALILAQLLDFPKETTAHLVSAALFVAGVTSLVQIIRIGPFGSGLLSAQGTSFAFLNALHQVGQAGGLPLMFGMCLSAAPTSLLVGPILPYLRHIFTPVVSGTVILLIGLSLIPAGMHSIALGFGPTAVPWHGLAIAAAIIVILVTLGSLKWSGARMLAVLLALIFGYGISAALGYLQNPPLSSWVALPQLFSYGIAFQWQYLIPFLFLYLVTTLETIGDVTATCQLSGLAPSGEGYWSRVRGAVMADGINSLIAACLGSFPNTTYAQNNGIIQLTGVASRRVGYFMSGFLILFGLFPIVGNYLAIMPGPVLGGLSLVLFGFVTTGGIRILYYSHLTSRDWLILAVALGAGIGVGSAPELLDVLPFALAQMFHSSVVTGGMVALLLNVALPRSESLLPKLAV